MKWPYDDDQEQSVHLTRDGIVIRGAGKPMRLTDTSEIELDSFVRVTRGLRVDGDVDLRGGKATHNGTDIGHQHSTAVCKKATTYPARPSPSR